MAAGCSTSSSFRMVAPSLVIVTSPISSTSICGTAREGVSSSAPGASRAGHPHAPWAPACGPAQRGIKLALSSPTGPRLVFRMLATARTAVQFCVRTSGPLIRSPWIWSAGAGAAILRSASCWRPPLARPLSSARAPPRGCRLPRWSERRVTRPGSSLCGLIKLRWAAKRRWWGRHAPQPPWVFEALSIFGFCSFCKQFAVFCNSACPAAATQAERFAVLGRQPRAALAWSPFCMALCHTSW